MFLNIINSDKSRTAQTKQMIQIYFQKFLRLLETYIIRDMNKGKLNFMSSNKKGDFNLWSKQKDVLNNFDINEEEKEISEFEEEIAKCCKIEVENTKTYKKSPPKEQRIEENSIMSFENVEKFQQFIEISQKKSETFKILERFSNMNLTEHNTSRMDNTEAMEIDDEKQENDEYDRTSRFTRNSSAELNITNDPSSNMNYYKKLFVPKVNRAKEKLKNQVPFLKTFNPKFLKKENIDKKILRKFRNYVKLAYKQNYEIFHSMDSLFWKHFCSKNLLPPMGYNDNMNFIEFKSFNTKYMVWLFKKRGTIELYSTFSQEFGSELLQSFIEDYNLTNNKEEPDILDKLKYYIINLHNIYSTKSINCNSVDIESSSIHLSNTISEEVYDSIIGPDITTSSINSINIFNILKDNFKLSVRKCAQPSGGDFLNDDYNRGYNSFVSNLNNSMDSIASAD